MRHWGPLLLIVGAALYVVSGAVFLAGSPHAVTAASGTATLFDSPGPELAPIMLARPDTAALRLLLVGSWMAAVGHALRSFVRASHSEARDEDMRDHQPVVHASLAMSLVAGAVWPWAADVGPVAGLLAAAAMLTGALAAAVAGDPDGPVRRMRGSVGFYAGFATAAFCMAVATLLSTRAAAPGPVAVVVGIGILAALAMLVQLRIGGKIGYSVAVIWALIGLAAAAMTMTPLVVTTAVLAIAALSAVLVRVTT